MKSVGIRSLQQNAAAVLRRVRRGERLEVTDRGQRIAWLLPATSNDVIERLAESGALRKADGDVLDLGSPLRLRAGVEPASKRLARMRENER
jgi:prevent-host-death family protein